jgi:hypothetical protein
MQVVLGLTSRLRPCLHPGSSRRRKGQVRVGMGVQLKQHLAMDAIGT